MLKIRENPGYHLKITCEMCLTLIRGPHTDNVAIYCSLGNWKGNNREGGQNIQGVRGIDTPRIKCKEKLG